MRTELRPLEAPVTPGQVTVIEIEVANTADVIDGITARVEGLDPGWVHLPTPVLSLFPDSTGVLPIHVTFPRTTVVGDYLVVVHIESTIDPARHSTHDLWLHVEPVVDATLRLRPSVVTKGKTATFAAIVTNKGNVTTDFTMGAADETRVLDCRAVPLTLTVPAAQHAEAEVWVRGPRPWFGQALARTVIVTAESPAIQLRELATFNQKPRIPRGVLTFAILAAIVALWATIFLAGADLLRADEKPTKAVAENFATGVQDVPLEDVAASVSGKVTARSNGEGVARVTVEALRLKPDGKTEATGSAATAEDGTYTVSALLPGTYKLRFTADGYDKVWYPEAPNKAAAGDIELNPKEEVTDKDVTMTGKSGELVGTVTLPDSADPSQTITVTATQVVGQTGGAGAQRQRKPRPIVQETTGPVSLTGLVTPATYRISIQAEGFDTQEFEQDLSGGQAAVLNTVRLGAAPGSIAGIVRSSTGDALGNVKVVATSGELVKETTTPTTGNAGAFLLDKLETPRTWVLTFTRDGFSSQTIALDLGAGQERTGVEATLTGGTGTITGAVSDASGSPLGDVTVTVAGGEFLATTATLTTSSPEAPVGSYRVADVPTPGVYAVTFSKEGFVAETRDVEFTAPGVQPDVSVVLGPDHGTITGTVRSAGTPIAGVTVELTDGRTAEGSDEVERRTTATASSPAGGYTFTGVAPGAYTVTFTDPDFFTRIVLVQVARGDELVRDVQLEKR
jgi:5-hydroxyisourate hydrolase-like protein (transthyretin family)